MGNKYYNNEKGELCEYGVDDVPAEETKEDEKDMHGFEDRIAEVEEEKPTVLFEIEDDDETEGPE